MRIVRNGGSPLLVRPSELIDISEEVYDGQIVVFGRSGLFIFIGLLIISWEELSEKCGKY